MRPREFKIFESPYFHFHHWLLKIAFSAKYEIGICIFGSTLNLCNWAFNRPIFQIYAEFLHKSETKQVSSKCMKKKFPQPLILYLYIGVHPMRRLGRSSRLTTRVVEVVVTEPVELGEWGSLVAHAPLPHLWRYSLGTETDTYKHFFGNLASQIFWPSAGPG